MPPRRRARQTRRTQGEGTYWYDEKTRQHRYRIRWEGRNYAIADLDPTRAKAAFERLKQSLKKNTDVDSGKQSLTEYLAYWLENEVRRSVSESTYHDYQKRIELYIVPDLGEYRLCDLSPKLLRTWMNAIQDTYALSSAKQARSILERALDLAVADRVLEFNPVASVKAPRVVQKPTAGDDEQGRALSVEQVKKLLDEVKRTDKHHTATTGKHGRATRSDGMYVLYALAERLGMRRGEILGLRWKDIDLEKRELRVRQQVIRIGNKIVVSDTLKTPAARRTLPLTDELVSLLRQHRLKLGSAGRELVFPNEEGEPRQPNAVTQHFRRTIQRLKLGDFHFHDLRATAITRWREAGVDLEVAAALAGHEKVDVTADTYSDPHMERKRSALEKIG